MSQAEAKTGEVNEEVILSKASELIVRLRELEQRARSDDLKKVWQDLRSILGEARQYNLERSLVPLVRKIKAIIRWRYARLARERSKAQAKAQVS